MALQDLYKQTALEYKKFFDHVHESFTKHCEEIKVKTNAALDATAEEDSASRQKILADQKQELDTSLAELKKLLDTKGREARTKLEEIAARQEAASVNFEAELESLPGEYGAPNGHLLLAWVGSADLAAWWISLAAETVLVATVALFFATSMAQTLPAIAAAVGLYVLARAIPAIQAIAGGPLAADTAAGNAARWTVDAFALLLPRLDAVARSDWLLYGTPAAGELAQALAGLAVYVLLLGAAGLFDFSRRNL